MSAELTVISWRDIPAQVVAQIGRKKARAQLSLRFQEAIDMAATKAGLTGTDAYLEEWRRETMRLSTSDLEKAVASAAERIEAEYTDDRLTELIVSGGVATS